MTLDAIERNQKMEKLLMDTIRSMGESGQKLYKFVEFVSTLFVEHDGVIGCVKHRTSHVLPEKPSENSTDINLKDITNIELDQVKKNGLNGDYSKEFTLHL